MSPTFGRTSPISGETSDGRELRTRNRLTLRVLLGILTTLALATLLAGIRW
jgi:hypothetical protein